MRKILFIIILVSLFSPSLVEAKFRPKISIAGADFRSIPTYITEPVAFKKLKKKDLALKKKFFWRIKRSFSVCGVFGVHKTKLESEKGEGFIPSMIRYPKWQDQGIELLIKSGFARFGNKVKIEFRVYDVLQKAQLFNKKYTVKENRLNDAIYDLADKVYKLYTGVRSNLFSKLVYAKRNPNGHQLIFK